MNQSKISVRYAKALYSLAAERGVVDNVRGDVIALMELLKSNDQFILLLESPVIKTKQKLEIVHKVFDKRISDLSLDFLDLLFKNNREVFLNDICRNFVDIIRKNNNIMQGSFITATVISPEIENRVIKIAEEFFKTKIELNTVVDQDLIGGYVLRVGDSQLDASISTNLSRIKRQLISTDFDIKY